MTPTPHICYTYAEIVNFLDSSDLNRSDVNNFIDELLYSETGGIVSVSTDYKGGYPHVHHLLMAELSKNDAYKPNPNGDVWILLHR